jgi:hypothetical protein
MNRLLSFFAILIATTVFAQSDTPKNQNGIFQALTQTDGSYNLGNWDGSRILSAKGDVLSVVSIKNGKIDFSRPAGQTRTELLKTLYAAGLRTVHISTERLLIVSPNGNLLAVLKETDGGFDLNTAAQKTAP